MDSQLRYGLGYVSAWPFFEHLAEIRVGQALGAGFLNRLPLPDIRQFYRQRWFSSLPRISVKNFLHSRKKNLHLKLNK